VKSDKKILVLCRLEKAELPRALEEGCFEEGIHPMVATSHFHFT
jgi:hypothetical protein